MGPIKFSWTDIFFSIKESFTPKIHGTNKIFVPKDSGDQNFCETKNFFLMKNNLGLKIFGIKILFGPNTPSSRE